MLKDEQEASRQKGRSNPSALSEGTERLWCIQANMVRLVHREGGEEPRSGQKQSRGGWEGPDSFFLKNRFIYLFIYLFIYWLHWVFVAARGLPLVAASGGCSSLQCAGFSLRWPLLLRSTGSRHAGFNSCGAWAQ